MTARHVVVDLGGVLFPFDHAHRLHRLSAAFGLSPERVDEALWTSGFSADCDRGVHATAAEVRSGIRAATGFTGSDETLDTEWCSAFRPDRAVAAELLGRTPQPVLFTNNGPLEEEVLTRLYPEMFEGFGRLVFSHRIGHRKPEAAAFAAVTELLGARPGDVLLIDDSLRNTEAARAFGWDAVHYRGPRSLHGAGPGQGPPDRSPTRTS
ncbi:HAD family hydrolase [Streptomyces sp. LN549]|uniref:HAD family hydrolase n=1 Tax=Streptomyces sp. LN549 TaxID=3112979 RepID=UPI00371C0B36